MRPWRDTQGTFFMQPQALSSAWRSCALRPHGTETLEEHRYSLEQGMHGASLLAFRYCAVRNSHYCAFDMIDSTPHRSRTACQPA